MSFLKNFHNEKKSSNNEPDTIMTNKKIKRPIINDNNDLIKEVYSQQTPLTDNEHVVPQQYEDAYQQDIKNAKHIEIELPKNDKFNDLYQETFETKEDDEMEDNINNVKEQIQIEQRNMHRFERGSQEWISSNQRLQQLSEQLVNMLTNKGSEDGINNKKDNESNVVDNQPTNEDNRKENIIDDDGIANVTSTDSDEDDIDIKDIASLPKEQLNRFLDNLRINKPDAYNQLINSMTKLEQLTSTTPISESTPQVNNCATSAANINSEVNNEIQSSQALTSETTETSVKSEFTNEQITNNNRVSISQLDIPVFDNVFKEHSYLTINQQFLNDINNILVKNDRVLLATNTDNVICLIKTSAFSNKNAESNFIYLLCDQFDEYRQKLINLLNSFGNVSALRLLGMRYTIHHDK